MTKYSRMITLFFVCVSLLSCEPSAGLKPFSSDGCSLFPDSDQLTQMDWCSCCFEHDKAYWRGGTEAERIIADQQLKQCVIDKTNNPTLADVMYEGVRFGGSPYFYTWYRWGYGWHYDRKYQALTFDEQEQADHLLGAYSSSKVELSCTN